MDRKAIDLMRAPKHISEVMDALHQERIVAQAKLDAIELAIDNLSRVWTIDVDAPTVSKAKPVPSVEPRRGRPVSDDVDSRNDALFSLIAKSPVGLTNSELRMKTKDMDGKARSNALQRLKLTGRIQRAGNTWVKAA